MSGGHIANFKNFFRTYIVFSLLLHGLVVCGVIYWAVFKSSLDENSILGLMSATVIFSAIFIGWIVSSRLVKPTEYIAQAIFHVSPNQHIVAAPNIENLGFGRELVASLTRQIYDYAASAQPLTGSTPSSQDVDNIIDELPISVIGIDQDLTVTLINKTAEEVLGLNEALGINLNAVIQMKFVNETIADWLASSKETSINSTKNWQKVEIMSNNRQNRSYFDIAAVTRQEEGGTSETMLVLFNHNEIFEAEEDALSLIALSVHEIRTPLTILRGYIEVLREELAGKLDAQSSSYVERLSASSESLASFMANVLSVVKADQDQLTLHLVEADWKTDLTAIIDSMQTRAKIRGKNIVLHIAENLPSVALDNISINEVLTNLIDNSIKYSDENHSTIWVDASLDNDGSILTTVRDEGVGIPDSVVPNLFTRFYRNHRNQKQIAGTGLGLFISKEIVVAHHGNIWVKSKEETGTTIGFTLIPFTKLADVQKTSDNGFIKVQHGWIKNHSMQRR